MLAAIICDAVADRPAVDVICAGLGCSGAVVVVAGWVGLDPAGVVWISCEPGAKEPGAPDVDCCSTKAS